MRKESDSIGVKGIVKIDTVNYRYTDEAREVLDYVGRNVEIYHTTDKNEALNTIVFFKSSDSKVVEFSLSDFN